MLAIRMQRLGRKGHPTYRIVVQDSRQTPTSGKYVALLGSYDPHAKTNTLVKDKAQKYLDNGAQPSDRVIRLFKSEGIKLPSWVKEPTLGKRTTRNPEKLRKNQPVQPVEETPASDEVAEKPAEEAPADEVQADTVAEADAAAVAEETTEAKEEAPAEEPEAEAKEEKKVA